MEKSYVWKYKRVLRDFGPWDSDQPHGGPTLDTQSGTKSPDPDSMDKQTPDWIDSIGQGGFDRSKSKEEPLPDSLMDQSKDDGYVQSDSSPLGGGELQHNNGEQLNIPVNNLSQSNVDGIEQVNSRTIEKFPPSRPVNYDSIPLENLQGDFPLKSLVNSYQSNMYRTPQNDTGDKYTLFPPKLGNYDSMPYEKIKMVEQKISLLEEAIQRMKKLVEKKRFNPPEHDHKFGCNIYHYMMKMNRPTVKNVWKGSGLVR